MFVRVWGIWVCLFNYYFLLSINPVQYEPSWQGVAMVWVFLLLVHLSELQPVGRVGGQEWNSHGPRRGCVTSRGRGTSAEHSSTGLAVGIETQVNQGSAEQKGEQTDLLILNMCCTSFSPF